MGTKNDAAHRTRERIVGAFFEEYEGRELRQVTVTAIAARAHVNRSTFYEYFDDVYDLVDSAQRTMLDDLEGMLAQLKAGGAAGGAQEVAALAATLGDAFIERNGERFSSLLSHGDNGFIKRLEMTLRTPLVSVMGADATGARASLIASFLLSGVTGCLATWCAMSPRPDIHELVAMLQAILHAGFAQLAGEGAARG